MCGSVDVCEVALKYKKLQEEKSGLESQVSTVKFFDLKRNLELAHDNILQSNKKLKEEQVNKKQKFAIEKRKKKKHCSK